MDLNLNIKSKIINKKKKIKTLLFFYAFAKLSVLIYNHFSEVLMIVYGAINDGYRFIYSTQKSIVEDWLYIYQENFCMLKVWEIEVPETNYFIAHDDLRINTSFNKNHIKQEDYKQILPIKTGIIFINGLALVVPESIEPLDIKWYSIDLDKEEQIILVATRKFLAEQKGKNGYT